MNPRIVFMGTPDFAVPALRMLVTEGYQVVGVITQPDRRKGRKKEVNAPPVKVVAQELGLPVFQPEKLREQSALQEILALKPDLVVTAAYGQLLPNALLETPTYHCVNIHASLLPRYRGGAPIHWAIVNGEKETGITLMYMAERLDAGDILLQSAIPITDQDDVGTLYERLSYVGAEALQKLLPTLLHGKVTAKPQDETMATYAPNVQREDEKISWSSPAREIFNHVRGFSPWPGTYTEWRSKKLKIWQTSLLSENHIEQPPGTILHVSEKGICVATQMGVIQIEVLQPAGKKKMTAADFIRGHQLQSGEILGESLS